METHLHKLLIRSLDETLSDEEKGTLDEALKNQPALQLAFDEMVRTRRLIAKQEFAFQPFFAGRVIQKVQETAQTGKVFFASMYFAFMRITIPALAICIILFLITYFNEGSLSIDTLTGVSDLSFDELLNDMFVSN